MGLMGTPRGESAKTPRGRKMSSGGGGEAAINVKVAVRVRPCNAKEENDREILSCGDANVMFKNVKSAGGARVNGLTYKYDHVFNPNATQGDVFQECVEPLVHEVMEGFNATLFCYGQTGTGKTYTMEGDISKQGSTPHAGIIPRTINHLFKMLQEKEVEYTVRVSYIELYNEELTDLLTEGGKSLKIFESAENRGSVCVHGAEDKLVRNEEEMFELLGAASKRKQVAETLMNRNSSRSHCIFIITVHAKEQTADGEDIVKTGKINLVDLAGSECIGRSGAENQQAVEAGNINKSLLTLGRVITSLVEGRSHTPYRDSKLTRLLADSLGGKTKTVMIATVSTSHRSFEETQSTLDYALRAKSIKNRPTVNQKMSNKMVLRNKDEEIATLQARLRCLHQEDGVVNIAKDKYEEMEIELSDRQEEIDQVTMELEQALESKRRMEEDAMRMKEQVEEWARVAEAKAAEAAKVGEDVQETKAVVEEKVKLYKGQKKVIRERAAVEEQLAARIDQTQKAAGAMLKDKSGLDAKVGRQQDVEDRHLAASDELKSQFPQEVAAGKARIAEATQPHTEKMGEIGRALEGFGAVEANMGGDLAGIIASLVQNVVAKMAEHKEAVEAEGGHAEWAKAIPEDLLKAMRPAMAKMAEKQAELDGAVQRMQSQGADAVASLAADATQLAASAQAHAAEQAAALEVLRVQVADANTSHTEAAERVRQQAAASSTARKAQVEQQKQRAVETVSQLLQQREVAMAAVLDAQSAAADATLAKSDGSQVGERVPEELASLKEKIGATLVGTSASATEGTDTAAVSVMGKCESAAVAANEQATVLDRFAQAVAAAAGQAREGVESIETVAQEQAGVLAAAASAAAGAMGKAEQGLAESMHGWQESGLHQTKDVADWLQRRVEAEMPPQRETAVGQLGAAVSAVADCAASHVEGIHAALDEAARVVETVEVATYVSTGTTPEKEKAYDAPESPLPTSRRDSLIAAEMEKARLAELTQANLTRTNSSATTQSGIPAPSGIPRPKTLYHSNSLSSTGSMENLAPNQATVDDA